VTGKGSIGRRRDEISPAAPAGFMAAYRELLALRPQDGIAFQPADIEVLFWG
jgi:hypothetical protein